MSERDIESYMKQFNVSRETAIDELNEILTDYHEIQDTAIQEVYADISRGFR